MRASLVGVALVVAVLVGFWAFVDGRSNSSPSDEGRSQADAHLSSPTEASRHRVSQAEETVAAAPGLPGGGIDARWTELNERAIQALEAGEFESAVKLFEECHEGEPSEPAFAANLAEALARWARALQEVGEVGLEIPIAHLERALILAPGRSGLAGLLERWKKQALAEAEFWTDESLHFRFSYDGGRSDLLLRGYYQLSAALEEAYGEFGQLFNHYPADPGKPKIRVVLYQRDEFQAVTGIGHWAGGVYDGVIRIPVADFDRQKEELMRILRHELMHAFLRAVGGPEVPGWLNEGLAQWHEEVFLDRRAADVQRARKRLQGEELFPLERLHGSLATWTDEEDIARGYAQALALTNFIARWYGEGTLYEMAEGVGKGKTCEEVFKLRIGVDLDAVVADLAADL